MRKRVSSWGAWLAASTLGCAATPATVPRAAEPATVRPAAPPPAPSEDESLSLRDRLLPFKVRERSHTASPAQRARIAERLLDLGQELLEPSWLERHREEVARANAAAGLTPTTAQFQAQLLLWQTELLGRLFEAMQYVPTPELARFASSVAGDGSAPLVRRKPALQLLDVANAELDSEGRSRREAIRGELARAEGEETGPASLPASVAALRPRFRECYQEHLRRAPPGALTGGVEFVLDSVGRVKSVEVREIPADMAPCIEGVVRGGTFYRPGRQQSVRVPLKFVPEDAASGVVACLKYDSEEVALRGVIEPREFAGPPSYQSVQKGDRAETVWLFLLDRPICTEPSQDGKQVARVGIPVVQLELSEADAQRYAPLLGQRVTARGRLFAARTRQHHTEVLLTVSEVGAGAR